ncbi:MAG: single-stranded-DNA-specific exonuclease [Patiriisocius sp.]
MEKIWKIKERGDEKLLLELSSSLNINDSLANILMQRGINSFDDAKTFFRPNIDGLHDPFLMKDMSIAVERLLLARANEEQVLIYGDYDVDGTTSVSVVYSFLRDLGMNVAYYIPDRYKEGYGVSYQGIDFANDNDFSLIIALDCGIKAVEKVAYANDKKIDFIICDHHRPGDILPPAVAVLDPKREDCNYPYKELCGCGVGFKLLQGFCIKSDIELTHLFTFLDLVAVAIGADIVPITGENRILCHYGLKQINANPRPGIKKLLDVAKVNKDLTITDLVFIIAPRINAAGRIDSGNRAVELLSSTAEDSTSEMVEKINQYNTTRRTLDKDITEQALVMIDENPRYSNSMSTVVHSDNWHKGVVGIVASRLIETHYKPTIVLTENEGKLTGSARSVKHFDVYNAIDSCSDLLENFGGHMYAAGLTMKKENINTFIDRFENYVSQNMKDEWLKPEVLIDQEMEFVNITTKFYNILKQMGPFGPRNMKPVFVSYRCFDSGSSRLLKEAHLKLNVFQEDNPLIKFDGIGFSMPEYLELVKSGELFDVVYSIEENHWRGKVTLQLMVKDIRLSKD